MGGWVVDGVDLWVVDLWVGGWVGIRKRLTVRFLEEIACLRSSQKGGGGRLFY